MNATQSFPLHDLVMDFSLYPRKRIDMNNVERLVESLRAGEQLPPIHIWKTNKSIVDGFHRYTALNRVYGSTHETSCVCLEFESEAAMFAEAWRRNQTHGMPIGDRDRLHCLRIAKRLEMDEATIRHAAAISESTYARLVKKKLRESRLHRVPGRSFGATTDAGCSLKRQITGFR